MELLWLHRVCILVGHGLSLWSSTALPLLSRLHLGPECRRHYLTSHWLPPHAPTVFPSRRLSHVAHTHTHTHISSCLLSPHSHSNYGLSLSLINHLLSFHFFFPQTHTHKFNYALSSDCCISTNFYFSSCSLSLFLFLSFSLSDLKKTAAESLMTSHVLTLFLLSEVRNVYAVHHAHSTARSV